MIGFRDTVMNIIIACMIVAGTLICPGVVQAQGIGLIAPGHVIGNGGTANPGEATDYSLAAVHGQSCTTIGGFLVSNGGGSASQCSTVPGSLASVAGPLSVVTSSFIAPPTIPGEELLSPFPQVANQMIATYAGVANNSTFGTISLLVYKPTTASNSGNVGLFGDIWYDSTQTESGSLSAIRGDSYIIAQLTATVQSGGSNNAVGDLLTIVGGSCGNFTTIRPIFRVDAVSGGAVTAVSFYNKYLGSCNVYPANPVSTTSSNGGATPPTINITNAASPSVNFLIGVSGRPKNQSGGSGTWMASFYADGPINASTGSWTNAAALYAVPALASVTNPPTNVYGVFFSGPFPSGALAAATGTNMTFGVGGATFYFSNTLSTAPTPPSNVLMTVSSNAGNIPALPLSGNVLALAALDNSPTRINVLAASSNGASSPIANFFHSRGTVASPGATQSGDSVFVAVGAGYGTSYQTAGGAGLIGKATENFDGTHGGTKLQLFATANGSVTLGVVAEYQTGMAVGSPTGGDPGSGIINLATGLRINGAAASGHYLRGNGTNYIDGTIANGDLPGSGGITIAIGANVGLTVSGCAPVSLGGTCTLSATTDTPQWTALGLGGAAPATGLRVYNAAAATTANGQSQIGASATNGGSFGGQGSTNDTILVNKNNALVCNIATGTTTFTCATATVSTTFNSPDGGFWTASGIGLASASYVQWNSDTFLTRSAAASVRMGQADAASPVAQTLGVQGVVAGTSNTAGSNWTFRGSLGTGNAAGGSIVWQTSPAGSSGTSQNAAVQVGFVNSAAQWFFGNNTAANPFANLSSGTMAATANADGNITRFAIVSAATVPAPILNMYSSRGTVASPTATQSGDSVGAFGGTGWGTAYQTNGGWIIKGIATETLDGTHGGSKMQLSATPNGASLTTLVYIELGGANAIQMFNMGAGAGNGALCGATNIVNSTGGAVTYDNGANCIVSLRSAKINIEPLGDALAEVMRLRPVQFRYRTGYGDDGRRQQVGLIAEEVETVDARCAAYDSNDKLEGVRYIQCIAVAFRAIQQLKADNDNLHADNDNLRAELLDLKRAAR